MRKERQKAVGNQERISYIHRVTGIKSDIIKKVLDASYLLDMNSIAEGKRVKFGSYYTIYPEYRKKHSSFSPYHNKIVTISEHWLLRVSTHKRMQEALNILKESNQDS
jgi:nucleoid DNA-binding protein